MSKVCAIVLAAGKGSRMGSGINKQFLNIKNKPVLYYSLNTLSQCEIIDKIIVVAAENEIEYCESNIIKKYNIKKVSDIVNGGKERQDSVMNGLMAAEGCDIILIHDGARPFIDERIIRQGVEYAETYGACTCGVTPKDTIKISDSEGFSKSTPDRTTLFAVQTPQCFKYELILNCHKRLAEENVAVTDDTMVAERYGSKVYLYEGSYSNIKITTQDDLIIGENIADTLQY